ncbi:Heterokaryon incompatibility protein (HET) domain containing protein [Hyaloscypha variabilis]
MHLLQRNDTGEFSLVTKDIDDRIPRYAILSHTWSRDTTKEVTFKGIMEGNEASKTGFDKIRFCGEQAKRDGIQYFWVDTCCIDKSSSAELSEAINSMFRWYRDAARCYVYLSDVSTPTSKINDKPDHLPWESAFRESRWFTRGWTLQELLASDSVEFFSREGNRLGDKKTLEREIHEITGIATQALRGTSLSQFDIDERLSWAESRQTSRNEDKAYSLLGIFGVYMTPIYGEGRDHAFKRLLRKIAKNEDYDMLQELERFKRDFNSQAYV